MLSIFLYFNHKEAKQKIIATYFSDDVAFFVHLTSFINQIWQWLQAAKSVKLKNV